MRRRSVSITSRAHTNTANRDDTKTHNRPSTYATVVHASVPAPTHSRPPEMNMLAPVDQICVACGIYLRQLCSVSFPITHKSFTLAAVRGPAVGSGRLRDTPFCAVCPRFVIGSRRAPRRSIEKLCALKYLHSPASYSPAPVRWSRSVRPSAVL